MVLYTTRPGDLVADPPMWCTYEYVMDKAGDAGQNHCAPTSAQRDPLQSFATLCGFLDAQRHYIFSHFRPAHAMQFAVYERAKELLGGNAADHNPLVAGVAGTVATVINDAIMTPVDVIKQRLQVRVYTCLLGWQGGDRHGEV